MISAQCTTLEGVDAHRTYQHNGSNQLLKQLTDLDTKSAQALKRLVQSGQVRLGPPGQASSMGTETCTSPVR